MATIKQVSVGLKILAKYAGDDNSSLTAEHDIIRLDADIWREEVLPEHRLVLLANNWHWDDDIECWAIRV